MDQVLVIGGTRFVGRAAVEEFRDAGYRVTTFTRGQHEDPFDGDPAVGNVTGDRTDESALLAARREVDPDVVVDCVAYHPRDVRTATDLFADVDAYVYVSSGAVYAREDVPKREGETPLKECTADQAADDSGETYGNRKAEGDRAVASAADRGVNAFSVRPTVVYGPHDYTERLDYWLARLREHDRVLVPGDGTNLWHRVYVGDVASAVRRVAEDGVPGEAYNVGDRNARTLAQTLELAADHLDADPELVFAGERELSTAGLAPGDFPLYRAPPHLLATSKLAALGWESADLDATMERTVAEHVESDRDGSGVGPDRADEERVLGVLSTVG